MWKRSPEIPKDFDKELMMNAMDKIISGDYSPIDISSFTDKEYGEKLNRVVDRFMRDNNNFVMRLNESMQTIGDCGNIKTMLDEVEAQSLSVRHMNEASQNIKDSIDSISDEMEKIRATVHEAIDTSQKSVNDMGETMQAVSESVGQINGINEKVIYFTERIAQISEIISMVQKISKQSSMLALNASIEAARAGEAGKGFAVVANQVTELAKNTANSAQTISGYVSELQTSIGELKSLVSSTTEDLNSGNEKVRNSLDNINKLSTQMDGINSSISNVYDSVNMQSEVTDSFMHEIESIAAGYDTLAKDCTNTGVQFFKMGRFIDTARSDMARMFSRPTVQDFLNIFKVDHLIYTWRLYNNLSHFEHLRIEQLNNPRGCKFGLWAQSLDDERIRESRQFKDAYRYHESIHKNGCDSWYAAEDGDTQRARKSFELTLESFNGFSDAIDKLKLYMKSIGYTDETKTVVFRP